MNTEKNKKKRAFVGRGCPRILARVPNEIFDSLHQLARTESKSLNLAVIETLKLGLAVHQNGNSPDISRLLA